MKQRTTKENKERKVKDGLDGIEKCGKENEKKTRREILNKASEHLFGEGSFYDDGFNKVKEEK